MADQSHLSRRQLLQVSAGAGAAAVLTSSVARAQDEPVVKHGRIKQSVVPWCFKDHWTAEELIRISAKLGLKSVELIGSNQWPMMKELGLTCAIASSGTGFKVGFNNRDEWDMCIKELTERIEECAEHGIERIITFTGMSNGVSKKDGADNCVEGLKMIVPHAEKHGVTICMEILNTRDDSHPMKGHPGYQGNHCDYCIDIIKRVDSPNMKLLFDIYHVQIMDGDVIRRIHQHKDHIGHIHTAGNPGRGELNDQQEINYPAVMQALLDVGYDGYVGQEFIPTGDPMEGLIEAVRVCDV